VGEIKKYSLSLYGEFKRGEAPLRKPLFPLPRRERVRVRVKIKNMDY